MISFRYMDLVHQGVLAAGKTAGQGDKSPMNLFMMMIALVAISFYFIIFRPQKKEQAERRKVLENLKKGDKVVSIGGIHGTVVQLDTKSDTVTIEVDKNSRLTLLRSAVSTVVGDNDKKAS